MPLHPPPPPSRAASGCPIGGFGQCTTAEGAAARGSALSPLGAPGAVGVDLSARGFSQTPLVLARPSCHFIFNPRFLDYPLDPFDLLFSSLNHAPPLNLNVAPIDDGFCLDPGPVRISRLKKIAQRLDTTNRGHGARAVSLAGVAAPLVSVRNVKFVCFLAGLIQFHFFAERSRFMTAFSPNGITFGVHILKFAHRHTQNGHPPHFVRQGHPALSFPPSSPHLGSNGPRTPLRGFVFVPVIAL